MRYFLALMIFCTMSIVGMAQDMPAAFRLIMETTELHTGQPYTVELRVDASDIWAFSIKIDYDPSTLYIIGTQAGQPIMPSSALNSLEGMTIFNRVQNNHLEYVYSRLSPAESANYDDTVATFKIYPLKAGTITLKMSSAEANRITFKMEGDQRVIDTQTSLPTGANELTLTITGDTVQPPLEATTTPLPQPTATAADVVFDIGMQNTVGVPTLIPLDSSIPTAQPQSTLTPLSSETPPTNTMPLLVIAFGMIVLAVFGFLGLWYVSRRPSL